MEVDGVRPVMETGILDQLIIDENDPRNFSANSVVDELRRIEHCIQSIASLEVALASHTFTDKYAALCSSFCVEYTMIGTSIRAQLDRACQEDSSNSVVEDILQLGTGRHAVEVDLMEPLDPEGKPAVHKPALNHVGLWVDDLEAAQTFLSNAGVRFTPGGIRQGASGHDVCFIHPRGDENSPVGGEGVLIELVQAPDQIVEAFV